MQKINLAMFVCVAACTSDSQSSARLSGDAVYRDAATDHAGNAQPAAAPPPQSASVSIVVKGTGQIPQLDPHCATDPAGAFEAHYASTMSMSNGNAYVAAIAGGSGSITTPSGCTIGNLTVGVVTDVVIRGELAINTTNCTTFCQSSARADAEASCGASASAAQCRADAEAQGQARCTTTCTTRAHSIVAEMSLGASAVGNLDADALRAAALGDLHANLTFDHLEDANGQSL
jgi:hypothetical protein